MGGKLVFYFGQVKFEIPIRHASRDVKKQLDTQVQFSVEVRARNINVIVKDTQMCLSQETASDHLGSKCRGFSTLTKR